jgi:hypothetical protein
VALGGGRVLVSAVAEDTDDPVADGPVSAAALAVLDGEKVIAWTPRGSPSPALATGQRPLLRTLAPVAGRGRYAPGRPVHRPHIITAMGDISIMPTPGPVAQRSGLWAAANQHT